MLKFKLFLSVTLLLGSVLLISPLSVKSSNITTLEHGFGG